MRREAFEPYASRKAVYAALSSIFAAKPSLDDVANFDLPLLTSVVLTRGFGAASFTRATTAAVTDFEGLVRNCLSGEVRFQGARRVRNLVGASEDFAGAGWSDITSGAAGTVTANSTTSPIGDLTADTITYNAAVGGAGVFAIRRQTVNTTANGIYVFSVWLKAGTKTETWVRISDSGGNRAQVQVTLTSTWQRFSISATTAASITSVSGDIGADGNTGGATSAAGTIFAWGAMLENATGQSNQNPSEYVSVGVLSSPYHGSMVDGVKYFAYQNGNTISNNVVTEAPGAGISTSTLKGYFAEQQSTNLMLWSRDFTNAAWTKTSITAALDQVGADGVANSASSLTASGANGTALQTITQAATSATLSFDVKRITGTGTILIQQGATTLDITASINSSTYTRITLNASVLNPAIGFKIVTSGDKIAVDFGGFENLAFATSRIPTTSATVTRNADVLTYALAGNIAAAAGAAYAEIAVATLSTGVNPRILVTNNGGAAPLIMNIGSQPRVFDGTTFATSGLANLSANTLTKIASSWGGSTMKAFAAGIAGSSQAFDGSMDFGAQMDIGQYLGGFESINGTIKNVRIWIRALSDVVLQRMTT